MFPPSICEQLNAAVAEFAARERAEYAAIFRRTHELQASLPPVPELYNSTAALEPLRELVRERDRAIKRLIALEEQFVSAIDTKLSSLGLEMIGDSLRQARRLARSQEVRCRVPMAQLDLRSIIRVMQRDGVLQVEDQVGWSSALSGYVHEIASLHEQRTMRAFAEILEDVEAFQESGGDAKALVDYRTRTLNDRLRLERAIMSANRRWSEALSQLMSPSSSQGFQSLIDAALYPSLYPDPLDLRLILHRVSSLPDQAACKDCLVALCTEAAATDALARRVEPELTALAISEARYIISQDDRLRVKAMMDWLRSARYKAAERCKLLCAGADQVTRMPEWSRLIESMRAYESEMASLDLPVASGDSGTKFPDSSAQEPVPK